VLTPWATDQGPHILSGRTSIAAHFDRINAEAEDPWLERMNERFAVVEVLCSPGGCSARCCVLEVGKGTSLLHDFDRFVKQGPLHRRWAKHRHRRQVESLDAYLVLPKGNANAL
jgi:hypothetical protein